MEMKKAFTVKTKIGMIVTLLFAIIEVSEGAEGLITTYNEDGSVEKETTIKYRPHTYKSVPSETKPIYFEPAQSAPEKNTALAPVTGYTISNSPTVGKEKKNKNYRDKRIKRITETTVNGQTATVIKREMKSTPSSAYRDMIEYEIITDNRSGKLNRRQQYTKSRKAPATKRIVIRERRRLP